MNYNEFYKRANAEKSPVKKPSILSTAENINAALKNTAENTSTESKGDNKSNKDSNTSASDPDAWKKPLNGIQGYNSHLPMLALLASTGALGGFALSSKKKRVPGALFGGISLPALYLAYLYGARNKWFGEGANSFDTFVDSNINKPVNDWLGSLSKQQAAGDTKNENPKDA